MLKDIFNPVRVTASVAGKEFIFENGRIANQADGSVCLQCGGTVVLVTVCSAALEADKGFFPLTVEYSERMYAAGRIPGSYFRREIGRPSERENLVSRLIDRPIRPLFPKGLQQDVQVLATVISADQENDPDILAMTGASAAICLSSLPFDGPVVGARVGRINGEFVLNPTISERKKSDIDIVFAASRTALTMVEGEAHIVPEDVIIDALDWGRAQVMPLIEAQDKLISLCGREKMPFTPHEDDPVLLSRVTELCQENGIREAMCVPDKLERKTARAAVKDKVMAALTNDPAWADKPEALAAVPDMIAALEKKTVRTRIREEGRRIDGRDTKTVRPIQIMTGVLPRTHGSAIFRRGETKSLAVTTLGSSTDEQRVDSLNGDVIKHFMLHYNFPPFCVGEVKPVRLSRREIGHGALAEKSLRPVLPSAESFPFTIRVVSETVESNGSSSMASVCGSTLSLMDAGVPIHAPVAGVAMGLIKDVESGKVAVLTDIQGLEDFLGDMDFKVAGSMNGITAIQMDIKIAGIDRTILETALAQALKGRLFILEKMLSCIGEPRKELSKYAPKIVRFTINPEKIREVIGPGGKMINKIIAETGVKIDIEDDGRVFISTPDAEAADKARRIIEGIAKDIEVGEVYTGKVVRIMNFGAFVELLPGKDGMIHISKLANHRVEKVEDVVKIGDTLEVKVAEIDAQGRVNLVRNDITYDNTAAAAPRRAEGFRARPPRRDGRN